MKATALMIAAALLAFPAGAADMPVKSKVRPATPGNVHTYGDGNPACQVWTDGCRRCDRAGGTANCSNIGIACQPGPIRCETGSKPAP